MNQSPQGQQYQGYIAPQANTTNSMVSGLPPRSMGTNNQTAALNYGQSMQQQSIPQQPVTQQQIYGAWKTTVSYAPVQPSVPGTFVQTPDLPARQIQQVGNSSTGFAGGQQP